MRISETNNVELYGAGISAGIVGVEPVLTDNSNGTYDLTEFDVLIYDNSNHEGRLKKYTISGVNGHAVTGRDISDTPNEVRYLVVDNKTSPGTPLLRDLFFSQLSEINESDIIPIFTMWNDNNMDIHYVEWDTLGQGLPNMIHKRIVKTDRFKRESGVSLTATDPSMSVQIGSGVYWLGAVERALDPFDSSNPGDAWYFYHHTGTGLTVNVTTDAGGVVTSVNGSPVTGGTGYYQGDHIGITGLGHSGEIENYAIISLDTVVNGVVTALSLVSGGSTYTPSQVSQVSTTYSGWLSQKTTTGNGTYNNSYYCGNGGVTPLTNKYYTVNWIYRDLEKSPHAGYVLGDTEYQTFSEASASQPRTDLPPEFGVMSTLIGRIIVQKGKTITSGTSGLVESAFDVEYKGVPSTNHNDLGGLQGGVIGSYYHSDQSIDTISTPTFNSLVIDNIEGKGLKVYDEVIPSWGWRDLEGVEMVDLVTPATRATLSNYNGLIREFAYEVGDRLSVRFHMPHDYVPGTHMYIHIHWSHNGTGISGNMTCQYTFVYAKGHQQSNFTTTPKTITTTRSTVDIITTPKYNHIIDEVQFTTDTPGGTASALDVADMEIDGLILVDIQPISIPTITGGTPNLPYIHRADIHYQSTSMGTKDKYPNFYTGIPI